MTWHPILRAAGLALTLLLSPSAPGHGQAGQTPQPADLADVLAIEGVGEAAFSPDGSWLAYNLIPPYDQLADYSYWMRATGLSGHQLWVLQPASGAPPVLQPGLARDATNYLLGFSPAGDFLLVMEHKRGDLRLVACRPGKPACTRFEPMPDIRDRYVAVAWYNERLVWLDETRFVMPVRPHRLPGSEMRSRAAAGRYLQAQWEMAWNGTGVTASEVVSRSAPGETKWARGDLYLFDPGAGTARQLSPGRFAGVRTSPDGRFLAGARTGERLRPAADAEPVQAETHPIFDRRYAPSLIDTATGKARFLEGPYNGDPHSFVWSPDAARLAVYGWREDEAPEAGCFYVVETGSSKAACWQQGALNLSPNPDAPDRSWPGPARAAFLGDGLAMVGRAPGSGRRDWYLVFPDRKPVPLTEGLAEPTGRLLQATAESLVIETADGLLRIDAAGRADRLAANAVGDAVPLGRRFYASHAWSNEFRLASPLVRLPLNEPLELVAARPDSEGDAAASLVTPLGEVLTHRLEADDERVLAISGDARLLVTTEAVGDGSVVLRLRETGRPARALARLNTHLAGRLQPQVRPFSYSLSDPAEELASRRVDGCLLLPPVYDPGRPYPLLLELYPTGRGGRCSTLIDSPSPSDVVPDLWAARGFIYMRPALPLDFARTGAGPLEGVGDMLDQTIDALVSEGLVDPDRIVFFGSSQGGTLSLLAAVQSERARAIISMNGWADFFSHYYGARGLMRFAHLDQNGGDNRWRYECDLPGPDHYCPFGFGVGAAEAPERYARTSPVARARAITAPVMLVHTDFDYFDMAQYDEMFGALYRAGKEAVYVRYWGEGHGLSSPANIRDLWQRIDAFLLETGVARAGSSGPAPGP